MGYSASSYVVFGKKIKNTDIIEERKVRSCNHNTDLTKPFCAECGKPLYKIETLTLADEGYEYNKIGYFTSSYDSRETGILGFKLASTRNQDTEYNEILEPDQKMKDELIEFFTLNNIAFKEEDFKSYVYTYHSY